MLLAAQGGSPELLGLCQRALARGWDPRTRRGFVVPPWVACPDLVAAEWTAPRLPLASLGLLDLCAFHDQFEAVEICLGAAPAAAWGLGSVSACAGLCAARGAWRALDELARHGDAAVLLFERPDDPQGAARPALLCHAALGDPRGLSALGALRRAAGSDAFAKWLAPLRARQWEAAALARAWLGDASEGMWRMWGGQAKEAGRGGAEGLWRHARSSAKVLDSLGVLADFVAEAEADPWRDSALNQLARAACADARPLDEWWSREWALEAAARIEASSEPALRDSPASARLRTMAESREISRALGSAGSGPRAPAPRL